MHCCGHVLPVQIKGLSSARGGCRCAHISAATKHKTYFYGYSSCMCTKRKMQIVHWQIICFTPVQLCHKKRFRNDFYDRVRVFLRTRRARARALLSSKEFSILMIFVVRIKTKGLYFMLINVVCCKNTFGWVMYFCLYHILLDTAMQLMRN